MDFSTRKKQTLDTISSPLPDKSPKGNIDEPLIPLLNTINSHPSFFTTSSCSGRISILSTPVSSSTKVKKKAKGGTWVFISHELADVGTVQNLIFSTTESTRLENQENPVFSTESTRSVDQEKLVSSAESTRSEKPIFSNELTRSEDHANVVVCNLVFRFEPLIIAIECKDVVSAVKLVALAVSCGFRESGVTNVSSKRVIVAIRCSIRLEVPLGSSDKVMVSKEYLGYLVEIANEKMEANRKRSDSFHDALLKSEFFKGADIGDCESLDLNQEICSGVEDIPLTKESKDDTSNGVPELSLALKPIVITGEPIEKLYLWGHSACTLETTRSPKSILVFGGFGGIGRHARRNDSWLIDSVSGQLQLVDFASTPSPRLGHTASLVGELMFVIGGRADPGNVLNDVWVLNTTNNEWKQLQCSGIDFPQSHRHAAAVIGSNIYIFGGIHNGSISSAMYKLDTCNLSWEEVSVPGAKPSSRHSHTLVAYGSQLFMFGGYDGAKPLGDLYSFDIQSSTWKNEKMSGSTPYARFSHTMFVYQNYIGVLGGCPIKQHYQELSLFKVGSTVWKRIKLESIGEDLFVRCTTSIVGDDLVIVGGGASCYAFGTRFSEPMRINLLPLVSLDQTCYKTEDKKTTQIEKISSAVSDCMNGKNMSPLHWVLQVDKKHAKPAKDLLKTFGWLDMERKVYTQQDGVHICFPVTKEFARLYQNKKLSPNETVDNSNDIDLREINKVTSSARALDLLVVLHASTHADHVLKVKKASRSPLDVMKETVASLLNRHNLPESLLEQLPTRWERLGDIVVLPMTAFKDSVWDSLGKELWLSVAESLGASRLARQGRIHQMEQEIVGWRYLLGTTGGLIIGKMGFFIHLMQLSACSRGVIFLRSVGWDNLIAKRKLLLTCFLVSDTSRCLSLSRLMRKWCMLVNGIPMQSRLSGEILKQMVWLVVVLSLKEIIVLQHLKELLIELILACCHRVRVAGQLP
ncbi:tRNA wybutosine-synthesizing protein [Artemisia annua]|uniref:tRNA(Phe) 7-[(3-amino-3-carboxypropyl)-4-demethylwyosine(37)-N(4)]-methyltransferase n=1 Tax=Artemisia annua TaxID=35608 RepID=A0A2U1PW17_ARTAN|nr:tRNA wybutosine-synthesizing protein [Artemisia annua]